VKTLQEQLAAAEAEAKQLGRELSKYRGMTIEEAKQHDWNKEDERKQNRLWELGYKIVRLKALLANAS